MSYRGVVTSTDKHLTSVFRLDKRVQVSASLLTSVCNIPVVRPGQAVSLYNCHLVQYKGVKWLGELLTMLTTHFDHCDFQSCVGPVTSKSMMMRNSEFIPRKKTWATPML